MKLGIGLGGQEAQAHDQEGLHDWTTSGKELRILPTLHANISTTSLSLWGKSRILHHGKHIVISGFFFPFECTMANVDCYVCDSDNFHIL